jgi:hypothetical protein
MSGYLSHSLSLALVLLYKTLKNLFIRTQHTTFPPPAPPPPTPLIFIHCRFKMDNFQGNLSQNSFGHSQQRNHQPNHRVHQTYGAAPNAASAMDPNAANRGYYQGGVPMYFPGPSGFNNGLALQSGNAWNSSPPSRSSQFVPIAPRPPQNVQLSQTYVHPDNRTWNGIPMLEGRTSVLMQHLIGMILFPTF